MDDTRRVLRRAGAYSVGVTIPRDITARLKLKAGQVVVITEVDGVITVKLVQPKKR